MTLGSVVNEIEHDGLGRRIVKQVKNSADLDCTYKYYHDGQRVIEERNGSDQVIRQHVWGALYIDELVQTGLNDDPTEDDTVDTFYFAIHDTMFNVIGLVDDEGTLVERYDYTPYGQRTVYTSAGTNDPDCHSPVLISRRWQVGGVDQPYGLCDIGFQGLKHDEETGLVHNRARVLHPRIGRFLQRDPLGYPDGLNSYAAYHALHGGVDPSGHDALYISLRQSGIPQASARRMIRQMGRNISDQWLNTWEQWHARGNYANTYLPDLGEAYDAGWREGFYNATIGAGKCVWAFLKGAAGGIEEAIAGLWQSAKAIWDDPLGAIEQGVDNIRQLTRMISDGEFREALEHVHPDLAALVTNWSEMDLECRCRLIGKIAGSGAAGALLVKRFADLVGHVKARIDRNPPTAKPGLTNAQANANIGGGGGGGPGTPGHVGAGRKLTSDPYVSRYADGTLVKKSERPPHVSGPNTDAPHTVLRVDDKNNRIYGGKEFDADGNPMKDISFTQPTYPNGTPRPNHLPPPTQHSYGPNSTGGSYKRSSVEEPLK